MARENSADAYEQTRGTQYLCTRVNDVCMYVHAVAERQALSVLPSGRVRWVSSMCFVNWLMNLISQLTKPIDET